MQPAITGRWCYAIFHEAYDKEGGFIACRVVEDEPGYSVLRGDPEHFESPWYWGKTYEAACKMAEKENQRMGVSPSDASDILMSSMQASRSAAYGLDPLVLRLERPTDYPSFVEISGQYVSILTYAQLQEAAVDICRSVLTEETTAEDVPELIMVPPYGKSQAVALRFMRAISEDTLYICTIVDPDSAYGTRVVLIDGEELRFEIQADW